MSVVLAPLHLVTPFTALAAPLAAAQRVVAAGGRGEASEALQVGFGELGDERAAARQVDAALDLLRPRLSLRPAPSRGWRLIATSDVSDAALDAVGALALLVAAGGWRRLGRCAVRGCDTPFVDRTNGATRRFCDAHSRPRARSSAPAAPRLGRSEPETRSPDALAAPPVLPCGHHHRGRARR